MTSPRHTTQIKCEYCASCDLGITIAESNHGHKSDADIYRRRKEAHLREWLGKPLGEQPSLFERFRQDADRAR